MTTLEKVCGEVSKLTDRTISPEMLTSLFNQAFPSFTVDGDKAVIETVSDVTRDRLDQTCVKMHDAYAPVIYVECQADGHYIGASVCSHGMIHAVLKTSSGETEAGALISLVTGAVEVDEIISQPYVEIHNGSPPPFSAPISLSWIDLDTVMIGALSSGAPVEVFDGGMTICPLVPGIDYPWRHDDNVKNLFTLLGRIGDLTELTVRSSSQVLRAIASLIDMSGYDFLDEDLEYVKGITRLKRIDDALQLHRATCDYGIDPCKMRHVNAGNAVIITCSHAVMSVTVHTDEHPAFYRVDV